MGSDCTRCELHKGVRNVCIPSRGAETPLVMFVGMAPGREDDASGSAFTGAVGNKLREVMKHVGLKEEWVRYTNITKCVPWESGRGGKSREPTELEMDACSVWLDAELRAKRPLFVVPLGVGPTKYFLGDGSSKEFKLAKFRGRRNVVEVPTVRYRYVKMTEWLKFKGIEDKSLFEKSTRAARYDAIDKAVTRYGYKDMRVEVVTVFPTLHPASLLYGNPTAETDLLSDLGYIANEISGVNSEVDYPVLMTLDDVKAKVDDLISRYKAGEFPWVSCDIESTGVNAFDPAEYITTIGFCGKPGEAFAIPIDHHESPFKGDILAQKALRSIINNLFDQVPIVGHNFKFDYKFLKLRGFIVKMIAEDTELAAWDLTNDTTPHDLEYLTTRYAGLTLHKQKMSEFQNISRKHFKGDEKGETYNTDNYPLDLVGEYNALDCDGTQRLSFKFTQMLKEQGLYDAHHAFSVPALIPVAEMEINGCALDRPFMDVLNAKLEADINAINRKFDEMGFSELVKESKGGKAFTLNNPEDVSKVLFTLLGFKPIEYGKVRKAGKLQGQRIPSSDKGTLEALVRQAKEKLEELAVSAPGSNAYEEWRQRLYVAQLIQEYKGAYKLWSSYGKSLLEKLGGDGLLHPSYGIRHTATGRYNCKDPSFQIIPWHSVIKQAFISRFENGIIVSADESQMELRIFAMVTQDPDLVAAFVANKDIHRMVSSRILGIPEEQVPDEERRRIKTVVFGLLYGRGAKAIAEQENISVERAKEIISGLFEQFPKIKNFISQQHKFVDKHGYVMYPNGFRRLLPPDPSDDGATHRQAVNSPIQGTASDLAAYALIGMHKMVTKLGLFSRIYQFVHDSLGYDVAPGELYDISTMLAKEMVMRPNAVFPWCNVPLRADYEVGVSWGHFVGMKVLADRQLEFDGDRSYVDMLLDKMSKWGPNAPTVLERKDYEVQEKDKDVELKAKVLVVCPVRVKAEPRIAVQGLTTQAA